MLSRTGVRIAAPAAVLVAALIAFLVLDPAVNTGPLGNGGTAGGICVPIARGQVESWGLTYLANTGGSGAVIQKIDLVDPRHLRLVAAYVVPITGNQEYGSWFGYPPTPHPQPGVNWPRHTRATGAQLPPVHGLDHSDLVAVIQPTAPVAEAQGIDAFYEESGINYHMRTPYRLVLLAGQKTCTDNWPEKYPG